MDNPDKLETYGKKSKTKNNTICVGHHYTQTNTNNIKKTWALLQTTGGKVMIIGLCELKSKIVLSKTTQDLLVTENII